MRIFLSFNSRDTALAEVVRAGLSRIEPRAQFSSASLGAGLWLPELAKEIAEADSFPWTQWEGFAVLMPLPWGRTAAATKGEPLAYSKCDPASGFESQGQEGSLFDVSGQLFDDTAHGASR